MSMDTVYTVLEHALPGLFVVVAFDDECEGNRIAWGYIDRRGGHHHGLATDFRAAVASACLWGFALNVKNSETRNETPVAS